MVKFVTVGSLPGSELVSTLSAQVEQKLEKKLEDEGRNVTAF